MILLVLVIPGVTVYLKQLFENLIVLMCAAFMYWDDVNRRRVEGPMGCAVISEEPKGCASITSHAFRTPIEIRSDLRVAGV